MIQSTHPTSVNLTVASKWSIRLISAVLLSVLVILLGGILITSSVSIGGFVTEKMLGRSGVADSSLLLGSTTNNQLSVLGFAPVVSTQTVGATGVSGASATAVLRGRVTSMNGLPTATGYFQWGYASGALTNTTTTFSVTSTGDYSLTVTGFNPNNTIYYRFVTNADGTSYGTTTKFVAASGTGGWMLKTLLRILLAAGILATVLLFGSRGGGIAMLVSALIGLIGFTIISSIIERLL